MPSRLPSEIPLGTTPLTPLSAVVADGRGHGIWLDRASG